jgi:hypothetical protein
MDASYFVGRRPGPGAGGFPVLLKNFIDNRQRLGYRKTCDESACITSTNVVVVPTLKSQLSSEK